MTALAQRLRTQLDGLGDNVNARVLVGEVRGLCERIKELEAERDAAWGCATDRDKELDRASARLAAAEGGYKLLSQLFDERGERLAAAERDIKTFGDPALLAAKLVLAERVVDAAREFARFDCGDGDHAVEPIREALHAYDAADLNFCDRCKHPVVGATCYDGLCLCTNHTADARSVRSSEPRT